MRSAKETTVFPYNLMTICYILVSKDGTVDQVSHEIESFTKAYKSVKAGEAVLYAVWPGNYRSDMFIIDDLDAFADKVGVIREEIVTPNICHYSRCPYCNDSTRQQYIRVDCVFEGVDNPIDLITKYGIKKIAYDLGTMYGWKVAVSEYSSSGNKLTLKVHKNTIRV